MKRKMAHYILIVISLMGWLPESDQSDLSDILLGRGYFTYIKKLVIYKFIYVIFNTITCHITALMKCYFII